MISFLRGWYTGAVNNGGNSPVFRGNGFFWNGNLHFFLNKKRRGMKQSCFPGSDHEEKVLCLILKNLKKRVFIIKKKKQKPIAHLTKLIGFLPNVTNDTKTTFFTSRTSVHEPVDAYIQSNLTAFLWMRCLQLYWYLVFCIILPTVIALFIL